MNTELQNQAWASLPDDFKREVREMYYKESSSHDETIYKELTMEAIFGLDNLTAEEKPKPIVSVDETKEETMNGTKEFNDGDIVTFSTLIIGGYGVRGIQNAEGKIIGKFSNGYGIQHNGSLYIVRAEDIKKPLKRWKPKKGERFMFYDLAANVIRIDKWIYNDSNNAKLLVGNVFKDTEQAEEATKRVREVLEKYHEEIGE